jgi:hypothetical protein
VSGATDTRREQAKCLCDGRPPRKAVILTALKGASRQVVR